MSLKVCGMRAEGNILEASVLPIDYMGFIFYGKSPRHAREVLTPNAVSSLPRHIKKVGVFVDNELSDTLDVLQAFDLDVAQLHGSESPAYCQAVKEKGYGVSKVFSIDSQTDFALTDKYQEVADFFLFDTKSPQHGGTGLKFDWSILERYQGDKPVMLSGGIGPEDASHLFEYLRKYPWIMGLDLNSRFEVFPGIKDIEKVGTFISNLQK